MSDPALQLTFSFSSLAEAEQFLAAVRHSVPKQVTDAAAEALDATRPTQEPTAPAEQEKPKRGRGRPKKNSTAPITPDSANVPTADPLAAAGAEANPASSNPPTATATVTADNVREALYALTSTAGKSMADGLEVLKAAGVQRVPELQPEQYAAVIADCNARAAA